MSDNITSTVNSSPGLTSLLPTDICTVSPAAIVTGRALSDIEKIAAAIVPMTTFFVFINLSSFLYRLKPINDLMIIKLN